MNHVAQLSEAFSRLSKQTQRTQYYYGCVLSVDKVQDTCRLEVLGVDVEIVVNLRVGRQALEEACVAYPKVGSQVLFFAEDEDFAKAYLIAVSNVEEVVFRTSKGWKMRCNEQPFTLYGSEESLALSTSGSLNCTSKGFALNAGGEKISVENGSHDLKTLLSDLLGALTSASVVTPTGTGTLDPATLTKLQTLTQNIQAFFDGKST